MSKKNWIYSFYFHFLNQNHYRSHLTTNFFHLVPDIPESFLVESFEKTNQCREELIYNQRISTLLPLFQSKDIQISICNKNKKQNILFSNILFQKPTDALSVISPQQVQLISNLASYVFANPETMFLAMQNILVQSTKKEISKAQRQEKYNDFLLLCYSAIPSFFGFFSTYEHLSSAFSFYCTVVSSGTSSLSIEIVKHSLIPFYCNGCTYRFIEKVFDQFGTAYCHDPRFNFKQKLINASSLPDNQNELKLLTLFRDEYLQSFANAIINSYQLLPQPHQFLIKFMKVRGWPAVDVLYFFIHDFILTQVLNILKSTPFTTHYECFSTLFVKIIDEEVAKVKKNRNDKNTRSIFNPLLNLFLNAKSFFEVPSAYSVFDLYYTQILTTTSDVRIILDALIEVNTTKNGLINIPEPIKQFIATDNIDQISYDTFWINLYSRKPKTINSSFNWRPVVFPSISIDGKDVNELDTNLDNDEGLSSNCIEVNESLEYCKNSRIFERYLVHQMESIELQHYFNITDTYFKLIILPDCYNLLRDKINIKNWSSTKHSIPDLLNDCMHHIQSERIAQLLLMTIIKSIIPTIVPSCFLTQLQLFEKKWQNHLEEIRQEIQNELPDIFKYKKGNERTALLLNKQLWSAIDHLKCLQIISFEYTLHIIIDSLIQLDDLCNIDDNKNSIIQYTIVISDCPTLISRFLLINTFIFKQKLFNGIISNHNFEKNLWFSLEIAVLKLLEHNKNLLNEFLIIQEELFGFPFANCFL